MSIILIGGPTGIGKTTLINSLIKGSKFVRPTAYTTRTQRMNDISGEYVHVTLEQFEALVAQDAFLNVDKVYGNYYGVLRDSVNELRQIGKRAIKEFHPDNHKKIKKIFPDAVSVLMIPESFEEFEKAILSNKRKVASDQLIRLTTDKRYYSNLDPHTYPFDIVLVLDMLTPVNTIKSRLLARLRQLEKTSEK